MNTCSYFYLLIYLRQYGYPEGGESGGMNTKTRV